MAKIEIEYRRAELRASTAAFEVAGRAASYNKPSQDLGGFVERLQRGCFTDSLQSGSDVKCLVNHDENQVLGRTLNKTLTLTDTLDGLNFVCALNKDSQAHRDLYASVKRGDLSECSFAFIVDGDDGQDFSSPDTNGAANADHQASQTAGRERRSIPCIRKRRYFSRCACCGCI